MLDDTTTPADLTEWLSSGSTGASAESIAAHLAGHGSQWGDYPHDADDFGRCERLLDLVPSLRADLHRMAEVNAYWAALVPHWDDIRNSKHRSALIQIIIGPIQEADPGHVQIKPGVSMRIGEPITFKGKAETAPRMKETEADREVKTKVEETTGAELRQFIERVERLEEEKKEIADQVKEVFAEAKGRGFDVKAIRQIIRERKQDPNTLAEQEAIVDMYKAAIGM